MEKADLITAMQKIAALLTKAQADFAAEQDTVKRAYLAEEIRNFTQMLQNLAMELGE